MISSTPFVVLDLETTGLSSGLDHIIELAAFKVLDGQIIDEHHSFVNPGVFLPHEATQYTGITTEMVSKAPRFEEIVHDLLSFFGDDSVFVAHNANFDLEFLNKQLRKLGLPVLDIPMVCTLKLARYLYPTLSKYSLGALAERFEIALENAHRASDDARATAHLLIHFLNKLKGEGVTELEKIPYVQLPKVKKLPVPKGQTSLF